MIVYRSRTRNGFEGHSWNLVALDDLSGSYASCYRSGLWQRLDMIAGQTVTDSRIGDANLAYLAEFPRFAML